MIGWHEDQEEFLETAFATNGGVNAHLQRRYPNVTSDALIGMQVWWDADIGRGGQELAYRRISHNEMTLSGKASDSGGTDWIVRFERQN